MPDLEGSDETMDDQRQRSGRGSLAAGFLAGFLGGELFLAAGLARHPGELFATSPTPAFAVWVLLRSVALYGLLFAAPGLVLGALAHLAAALRRRPLPVFALVSGTVVAATVLAYLTAWWQLDVLAGVPIDDRQRLTAGLWQAAIAAGTGAGWTALLIWWARRRVRRVRRARPPGRVVALALGALVLLAASDAALGLRPPYHPGPWRPSRVVLVGLDGLTLRVLSPLVRAGELPAFRRLIDEGAWGSLLTYGVASSPVVWTSVATGKKARDHGITDFVTGDAGRSRGRARTVRSVDRRVPAVWNILSRAGRTVAVVDWLVTSPPEAVNGVVATGLTLTRGLRASPREVASELAALLGDPPGSGRPGSGQPTESDPEQRQGWRIDRVFDATGHLLHTRRPDFLALYDRAGDNVSHRLWKYYQPAAFDAELWNLDPADAARLGGVIPAVYAHLDRRLGELLDRLDDEALVIVVSDHGQIAAHRPRLRLDLDRLLVALGFAEAEHGDPGGGLDYRRSRAYTQTTTRFASHWRVHLNRDRGETRGIIPAAEVPGLRTEVIRRLTEIRLEGGGPLFGKVVAGGREGADILVHPSRFTRHHRYLDRSLEIAGQRYRLADFAASMTDISGDHDRRGVIFLHGRGVLRGPIGQRVATTAFQEILQRLTDKVDALDRWLPWLGRLGLIERATTLDLTPTVLHALGLPAARDMAGRPLAELLAAGEPAWVDSYDDELRQGEPEVDRPPPVEEVDDEVLERLRALGYIN